MLEIYRFKDLIVEEYFRKPDGTSIVEVIEGPIIGRVMTVPTKELKSND